MSLKNDLSKYKPRKEQKEALSFIDSEYQKNKLNKFFLLNLPVGSGKSHLALMIADWYRNNVSKMARVDIITNSKLLQDQYSDTYESISDLKGKENYECESYSCSCAQGSEFNRLNKTSCESCPYSFARENYISGGMSLTNFYLYILYAIYNPKLMENRGAKVLIVDEAHEFDDVMSDFISIKITETVIKKFKFKNEKEIIKQLKDVVNIETYIDFLKYFLQQIYNVMGEIEGYLAAGRVGDKDSAKRDSRDMKINSILDIESNDVKFMQLVTDLRQYSTKIDVFIKEYELTPDNWVVESTYNEKTKINELSLEPIWSKDYLEKFVWSKYDIVVLMSGTILDKKLFSDINGIDSSKSVYYSVSSPFPKENRKIIYMPLGKMSYSKKEQTFKNFIPFFSKVLKKYPDVKGIIHTNSFELSKWIEDSVKDSRLVFHTSTNKDEMLRHHFTSTKPTVIVSPSVSTGVSFDNEKSRFQVIAKIPYPSLASQKNKMRQKTYPEWYAWRTVGELIQACGRSVRNHKDYADTIIIDGSFSDVIRYSSQYMPLWFQESIITVSK